MTDNQESNEKIICDNCNQEFLKDECEECCNEQCKSVYCYECMTDQLKKCNQQQEKYCCDIHCGCSCTNHIHNV